MNHVLIVDASASDSRIMTNLFVKSGYDPVVTDSIDSGKDEAAKLPPGTVIVTAMRLKDGTAIEFIDWLKIVGLRHQVVNSPVKAAFEDAVRISSEADNRAGEKRPVGSLHKDHRSIQSFDDYIGMVKIDCKEYYVRYTVQVQKGQNGIHSQFVSNIDLYDTTNPTEVASYRDSSLAARLDFNGIVDAKLRNFFILASENPLSFAHTLRA